jgi:VIT1/CCC1 family predicted Fe2+/Mn2+ transporter
MTQHPAVNSKLVQRLVLDELFDLSLYRALCPIAPAGLRAILEELIPIEARHCAFWQGFFGLRVHGLDWGRRFKQRARVAACQILGAATMHLVLEAIEVYGVRKYLSIWNAYRQSPLGAAVRKVLEDEFEHEDAVVTGDTERRMNPERVRNIFLELNDGLIEILGALSGSFTAFGNTLAVLAAASTVAGAGALSMAAGAYIAASSEAEVLQTESERQRFLGKAAPEPRDKESPLRSAGMVGSSHCAGALVPVLPVLFGASGVLPSVLVAGSLIALVSSLLAFLSGMEIKRHVPMNLVIIAAAVTISYAIGAAARVAAGISI